MGGIKIYHDAYQQEYTTSTVSSAYVRHSNLSSGTSNNIITGQSGGSIRYVSTADRERVIKIKCNLASTSTATSQWNRTSYLYLWASGSVANTSDVTPLTWTKEQSGTEYIYTVTVPAGKYLCLSVFSKSTNPTGGVVYWYTGYNPTSIYEEVPAGWTDFYDDVARYNEYGGGHWGYLPYAWKIYNGTQWGNPT